MMDYTIRRANEHDLPAILHLVKKLADYEHALSAVSADLNDYITAHKEGLITCDVAVIDESVIGCTIYYNTFSTWKGKMLYLEDFIVLEEFRRLGIGKALFDAFINESKARNCTMVKWQVLDWNEPAISFYKKEGATIEKEWWNVKIIY